MSDDGSPHEKLTSDPEWVTQGFGPSGSRDGDRRKKALPSGDPLGGHPFSSVYGGYFSFNRDASSFTVLAGSLQVPLWQT